jgi:hypothetical protein
MNNKNEIIGNDYQNTIVQYLQNSWPLFLCGAIYFLLDFMLDYTQPAKVSLSCFLGLVLMHFGDGKKVSEQGKHASTKMKSFVNDEEKMSKVDVAKCAVEIRYVKLIKKKWKFKICISHVNTEHQWREWHSFDELVSVQSQLLKDFEYCPDLTPQCRTLLKTPLDVEDSSSRQSHFSPNKNKKKSMEELNVELRHQQVSSVNNYI